jgi:hypothetical protein
MQEEARDLPRRFARGVSFLERIESEETDTVKLTSPTDHLLATIGRRRQRFSASIGQEASTQGQPSFVLIQKGGVGAYRAR